MIKQFIKSLTVFALLLLPTTVLGADYGGEVFRLNNDGGYDAMYKYRFMYYMTTADDAQGEHWATIILVGYPNTAEVAGFYLRVLDGGQITSPAGKTGEWGANANPSQSAYYDKVNINYEINGFTQDQAKEHIKAEFINVKFNCLEVPQKAIRIKLHYKNKLTKFRITYKGSYRNNGGNIEFSNNEWNFDGGTGERHAPLLSLDGSLADLINQQTDSDNTIYLGEPKGNSFCTEDPEPLVVNPINTDPITGGCGTLLASTNFSPKNAGADHITLDDIIWYDPTNSVNVEVYYPEVYSNGDFPMGEYDKGYAIVSNPKVLSGDLVHREDGQNRLIIKLPRIYSDPVEGQDPIFRVKLNGMKAGNANPVTMKIDWETVNDNCLVQDKSVGPQSEWLRYDSQIIGYTGVGDINIDGIRPATAKTKQQSVTLPSGAMNSFFWKPRVKISNGCTVIAIKSISIYGCPHYYIQKSIGSNLACEGEVVNLQANGFPETVTSVDWYRNDDPEGTGTFQKIEGVTARNIDFTSDLNAHSFYAQVPGTNYRTDTVMVQGKVCCSTESGSYETLYEEDFGTFPAPTGYRRDWASVRNHTYRGVGQCMWDGDYAVLPTTDEAVAPGACPPWEKGHGDHTGNGNGGFLLINVGKDATENDKLLMVYDIPDHDYCEGIWYNASIWVSQIANPGQNPANIIIRSYSVDDSGNEVLLGSAVTGKLDIFRMEEWINFSASFSPGKNVKKVRIKIFNRGNTGDGNDVCFDDLTVTSCSPQAGLTIHGGLLEYEYNCGQNIDFNIEIPGLKSRFFANDPWCAWQKSADGGITWTTVTTSQLDMDVMNIPDIPANVKSKELYRVVMAGDETTLNKIISGQEIKCQVFAVTNTVTVSCNGECPVWAGPDIYHNGSDN
ncbi:MAG: hypothetical protein MJ007_01225 [Paludibacteraceae bacterium]|nr:hypothetical protein [Paludibacteraceae bacterium]